MHQVHIPLARNAEMPESKHNPVITYGVLNMLSLCAIGLAAVVVAGYIRPGMLPLPWTQASVKFLILLQYLLYMLVGLRFMHWLYVFLETTRGGGGGAHELSPRWAYLGFGTPWLNLFLPYRIVLDLLESDSKTRHTNGEGNIQITLKAWWTLHLAYFFLAPTTFLLIYYQDVIDVIDISGTTEVLLFLVNSLLVLGVSRCAIGLVSHLERSRIQGLGQEPAQE